MICGLVLGLAACAAAPAAPEPTPDPVGLVAAAAQTMRSATTFRMIVDQQGPDYAIPTDFGSVNFRRADAVYVAPDTMQAGISVTALGGVRVDIEVFARAADQWFRSPVWTAGSWINAAFAPGFNPAALIAEETGFNAALNAVIVRPGAFYGPLGHYAFNRLFFRDPLRGLLIEVNGGRYVTFPVYIGDVAAGVLLAADRGRTGEVYNIVGSSLTHREVFTIVRAAGRLWYPRIRIPGWLGVLGARLLTAISTITRREPFYPINMRSYVYNDWRCSNAKARVELGFAPLAFAEGARRALAWYQAGRPAFIPEVEL